jgi:hypothetical protein
MKRLLNVALACALVIGTANAASAQSFFDRWVATFVSSYGGTNYYNPYYTGYNTGYYNPYYSGIGYNTPYYNNYYGYNTGYNTYNPYGYNYNNYYTRPSTSIWGTLGNVLLNWF